MTQWRSKILSTGMGLPSNAMSNADLEKFLDTSDEWIRTRTGIKTRYIARREKGETTLSLCVDAAKNALDRAGLEGSDIDMIVVGTVTPENIMPTTANQIQAAIGATGAFSFDMQAACSGFLYGLSLADNAIRAGDVGNALVIGAETLSTIVDWRDRTTAVLFGDAAGAAILQRTEGEDHAVLGTKLYSDGRYASCLNIPHGYANTPPYAAEYSLRKHKIQMNGKEVFKLACRNMVEASQTLLGEHGIATEEVDFFIFHQANLRIIDMCMKTLGVPKEKTWINLDKYGNTSAATLPICLQEATDAGAVKPGDLVLMATFGGGVTWASSLVRI